MCCVLAGAAASLPLVVVTFPPRSPWEPDAPDLPHTYPLLRATGRRYGGSVLGHAYGGTSVDTGDKGSRAWTRNPEPTRLP